MTSSSKIKYLTVTLTGKALIPLTPKNTELIAALLDATVIDNLYQTNDPRTGEDIIFNKKERDWPSIKISTLIVDPDHILANRDDAEKYEMELKEKTESNMRVSISQDT